MNRPKNDASCEGAFARAMRASVGSPGRQTSVLKCRLPELWRARLPKSVAAVASSPIAPSIVALRPAERSATLSDSGSPRPNGAVLCEPRAQPWEMPAPRNPSPNGASLNGRRPELRAAPLGLGRRAAIEIPRASPSSYHTSAFWLATWRAKRIVAICEIVHPLQADPKCLGPRFGLRTRNVSAQ